MEENKKTPFFRRWFNLFDIIVIVVILILAAVLLFVKANNSASDTAEPSAAGGTVEYTIELVDFSNGIAEEIKVGDRLQDKIKKYDLGVITSVEIKPANRQIFDYENERIVDVPSLTQQTAVITLSASGTWDDTTVSVGGGYDLRVGGSVYAFGPGYYSYGYVLDIDRSAE